MKWKVVCSNHTSGTKGFGAMVACRSPKPLMGVRIPQPLPIMSEKFLTFEKFYDIIYK